MPKNGTRIPEPSHSERAGLPGCSGLGVYPGRAQGLPEPVYQKLATAVKKVTDGEEFQKLLKHLELPYDFKDGKTMEKDVVAENAWYKEFLPKMGAKVIK